MRKSFLRGAICVLGIAFHIHGETTSYLRSESNSETSTAFAVLPAVGLLMALMCVLLIIVCRDAPVISASHPASFLFSLSVLCFCICISLTEMYFRNQASENVAAWLYYSCMPMVFATLLIRMLDTWVSHSKKSLGTFTGRVYWATNLLVGAVFISLLLAIQLTNAGMKSDSPLAIVVNVFLVAIAVCALVGAFLTRSLKRICMEHSTNAVSVIALSASAVYRAGMFFKLDDPSIGVQLGYTCTTTFAVIFTLSSFILAKVPLLQHSQRQIQEFQNNCMEEDKLILPNAPKGSWVPENDKGQGFVENVDEKYRHVSVPSVRRTNTFSSAPVIKIIPPQKESESAVKIQSSYRGMKARQILFTCTLHRAAVKVQSVFRGCRERTKFPGRSTLKPKRRKMSNFSQQMNERMKLAGVSRWLPFKPEESLFEKTPPPFAKSKAKSFGIMSPKNLVKKLQNFKSTSRHTNKSTQMSST